MIKASQLVLVALVLLALGWVIAPRSAPPVYDGLGFPDEPYRFLQRPPGTRVTKPPSTASTTARVTGGRAGQLDAASAESGPQVRVTIPAGMLRVSGPALQVTLTARPETMLPPPRGKYLWSNVYDITLTPPATFTTRADLLASITMRAATAQQPLPLIARFNAGRWTLLTSAPVGQDIYTTTLPAVGRYAVLGDAPLDLSALRGGGTSQRISGTTIAGIGVIAAVLVLLFLAHRRRAKARARPGKG